jgi:hypothetical protein
MELDKISKAWLPAVDDEADIPWSAHHAGSFRYSRTELSLHAGQAWFRHQETRYENGRLTHEECEATLDDDVCERMVEESRRALQKQVAQAMKLALLPFSLWRDGRG